MKAKPKWIVAIIASAAFVGAAVQVLQAQAKPPVYLIFESEPKVIPTRTRPSGR